MDILSWNWYNKEVRTVVILELEECMNNKVTFKPYDMNQLKLPIDLAIDILENHLVTKPHIIQSKVVKVKYVRY